jgi:hypothetical protein
MKLFATKHGKLLAAAAASILLYTAIGFLLFPVILKKVAVQELTRFLGRTVTIRQIDFNPYALSVAVHGFQVEESMGGVILSWDTLYATFAPMSSLLHHAWAFKEAVLLEPYVNILRNAGGSLNLADLLLLDWPKSLRLRFDLLRLVEGNVLFRDAALSSSFSTIIKRLTATVKDFSTSPDHTSSFSVSAVSESGEKFSWNGFFGVHPLSSRGEIVVENVQIGKYYPYMEERFDFAIAEGTLTVRASYDVELARDGVKALLHDGTIAASSLKVCEQGGTAPLFGFAGLALAGAQVDMVRQTIEVASIRISAGSFVLRRLPDNSFNFQHVIKPARGPSVTKAAASSNWNVTVGQISLADFAAEVDHASVRETLGCKELRFSSPTFQTNPTAVSVTEVALRDGELVFTDLSVKPPVRMAMTHLHVGMGGLSSANSRLASLAVNAKIENVAQLQISGETNPFGPQGETNLRGLLRNVNLVPLSPYAAKYLGYELTAGELSLDTALLIRARKINAENKMEIDRLTLGGKTESEDATELPVQVGIALLKDPSGRITLNVPIAGTLDDPEFQLQKAIIEAVLGPIKKTAMFPFAALGAQLGGGGEELGFQEFSSGSAELVPQEIGKLDTILQGLQRWPEFMLDIEGSVDAENDAGDLKLLAANRAKNVKEYLLRLGTLEPDRIFLIDNPVEKVPRKGSRALLYLKDKYRGPVQNQ